jgi:hypothetical protein
MQNQTRCMRRFGGFLAVLEKYKPRQRRLSNVSFTTVYSFGGQSDHTLSRWFDSKHSQFFSENPSNFDRGRLNSFRIRDRDRVYKYDWVLQSRHKDLKNRLIPANGTRLFFLTAIQLPSNDASLPGSKHKQEKHNGVHMPSASVPSLECNVWK